MYINNIYHIETPKNKKKKTVDNNKKEYKIDYTDWIWGNATVYGPWNPIFTCKDH